MVLDRSIKANGFSHIVALRGISTPLGWKEACGSDKEGRPKTGKLRLFRGVNRRLKDAIMGAALSAICQSSNPFADHYERMVRNGVTPSNARHTVARKMLSVMWGMWKTNCQYDENLV